MRKNLAVKVLLILAMVSLAASVVYAKPADCWYTGDIGYTYYTICNYCYVYYGNAASPDVHARDVYYLYACPDGTTGWDYIRTEVDGCYYFAGCNHI